MSSLLSLGTTIIDGHEAEVRMWESSVDSGEEDQEQEEEQQGDEGEVLEQDEEKGTGQEDPKDQAALLKKFYAKADRTMSAGIRVDLVTTVPTAKRCTLFPPVHVNMAGCNGTMILWLTAIKRLRRFASHVPRRHSRRVPEGQKA